jgi:hypothetical protein
MLGVLKRVRTFGRKFSFYALLEYLHSQDTSSLGKKDTSSFKSMLDHLYALDSSSLSQAETWKEKAETSP